MKNIFRAAAVATIFVSGTALAQVASPSPTPPPAPSPSPVAPIGQVAPVAPIGQASQAGQLPPPGPPVGPIPPGGQTPPPGPGPQQGQMPPPQGPYPPQGPGPQQGQMGPQGQGFAPNNQWGDGQGPRNDQGEKMRVQGMKRMVSQMEKEIARVEKRFAYFAGKNVPIPQETKDALNKVREITQKVKAATTADELDAAGVEDIGGNMETINEGLRKAETAAQFPRILKEVERQLTRSQSSFARAQKKSQSLAIDSSSLFSDWKSVLDAMVQGREKAKQQFSEGQTEDAIDTIQSDVMEKMDDLREKERAFEMVSNTQRMLKSAETELKSADRTIARLKAKKNDTSKLEEAVATAREKLGELKQLTGQSPVDPEAFIEVFQELDQARQDYEEELGTITGRSQQEDLPGFRNFQPIQMPKEFGNFMQGQDSRGPSGGENRGGPGFQPQQQGPGMMNQGPQGGEFRYMNQPGFILQQYQGTLDEIYRKALELKARITG